MRNREALSDDVGIEWDVSTDRVEVRIVVARTAASFGRLRFGRHRDPVLRWAQWSLPADIKLMLKAQLEVIPHELGEQLYVNHETGEVETSRDTIELVNLLEACSRREFGTLLRAPDVVDGLVEVIAGNDRALMMRLQKTLRRLSAGRPGAPRKDVAARVDLATAKAVAELEDQIAGPFEFARTLRGPQRRAARALLVRKFGMSPGIAAVLVASRTRRHAACFLVAERDERTVEAVKRAAARGMKHPDFILESS